MGNSKSPNKLSALITPVTGPAIIPTINKGKMAGTRILKAKYWQAIESKPTITSGMSRSSKIPNLSENLRLMR
jgi:hypothetical protein